MEGERKIDCLVKGSIGALGGVTDANTVLGTPVFTASGAQVIPFSRITLGNLSGGGEYGDVKVVKEIDGMAFAGGGEFKADGLYHRRRKKLPRRAADGRADR